MAGGSGPLSRARGDQDLDLAVAGAGPAGVAAALTAQRAGLRVALVDAATFPRDKTCGDGLTAQALRLLELLGVPVVRGPGYASVRDVVLRSPSGRTVQLPLPADAHHAGVVARLDLDATLVATAKVDGVPVHEGWRVAAVRDDGDTVVITSADGRRLRARWLIAADGHYSPVRRLLHPDLAPQVGEWSAFRQYWSGVRERRLWVLFERDLLPGYAWVFPLPGGRANVGFGMLRGPGVTGSRLARRWRELLGSASLRDVLGRDARPEGAHRAWPIPTGYRRERLGDRRVLFAGDAAGVVDPMTGEGIAQALETGILAAEAVASGCDVTTRYAQRVEERLGRDLRFARLLQRVLAHPLGTRAAIRAVDWNDWTRASFARWMFEDYPRAVLLHPGRWHRGMLQPPGAFAEAPIAS